MPALLSAAQETDDPQAILFDEPLTGLDPQGIRVFKRSLRERAALGAAVVISSHMLAMVEDLCTHVLILGRELQRFFGPIDQLRTSFENVDADASLEEIYFAARASTRPTASSPSAKCHLLGAAIRLSAWANCCSMSERTTTWLRLGFMEPQGREPANQAQFQLFGNVARLATGTSLVVTKNAAAEGSATA